MDIVYPCKRLLALEFTLNKSCKNLIKDPSDTNDYDVVVASTFLDLSYITLEETIRRSYYDLIEREKLIRVISGTKESHFSLHQGSSVYFIPNLTSYGKLPLFVTLFVLPDKIHFGNHTNAYRFEPLDIESIELFVDGNESFLNDRLRNLDYSNMLSTDVSWAYRSFLENYGDQAKHVSLRTFFTDFFLLTFPILPTTCVTSKDSLSLIRSGSVNLTLKTKANTTQNYILYCHSHYKSLVTIDVTGEILETV